MVNKEDLMTDIFTSQVSVMKELKDIFIELTAKNCNNRCKNCYIDFPLTKNVKDFIKLDVVKDALIQLKGTKLNCIYLTGAEPMTHPDMNTILRLCLRFCNVCICTNATMINEKKARFLKRVEGESKHQILFKLSFTHYNELMNDDIRFRGSYRQNIYALKCLNKYDFTNIVSVANYYNEPDEVIIKEFTSKLADSGIENFVIQVNKWCDENATPKFENISGELDCMTSRTITKNGIFSCPFLANDYRGRCGSDFNNYSKSVRLETPFCATCIQNKEKMCSIDFE